MVQILNNPKRMKLILSILNTLVIIASIAIIVIMSLEVLYPDIIDDDFPILKFHFAVSIVFLSDFFIRLYKSKKRTRFFLKNILFFIVSLPILSFSVWFGWEVDKSTEFMLRYIFFLRSIYGFVIVFGYLTRSRITNLFYTYIVLITATTYFCSLLFFLVESPINPGVKSFGDALWWALMDMTTVGSNIVAHTNIGRVISVLLAASGMMLFPIFTVYITDIFNKRKEVDQ